MTTVPSTGTGTSTPSTSATTVDRESADSNFQDFLKLLTTQLQNQDPTAPTDTNQLTQQIATLSQVEQQISTNQNLQQLITLFGQTQTGNMVSYIGKDVDSTGNSGSLQNGAALFAYSLPSAAKTANVSISDSTGKVVFTASGPTAAGRNQVIWDGTDNNGNQLNDGTYTIAVKATDAAGKDLAATTYTTGIVTAVDTESGVSTLAIGDLKVNYTDVLAVRNISAAAPTDTSSTNTPTTPAAS